VQRYNRNGGDPMASKKKRIKKKRFKKMLSKLPAWQIACMIKMTELKIYVEKRNGGEK
jgi:hypothetical protein